MLNLFQYNTESTIYKNGFQHLSAERQVHRNDKLNKKHEGLEEVATSATAGSSKQARTIPLFLYLGRTKKLKIQETLIFKKIKV